MSKKITLLFVAIITLVLQFSVSYCQEGMKAYYSGKVISFVNPLLNKDNTYLINSSDFDSITGSNTAFDSTNKIVTIKYSGAEYACTVASDNSGKSDYSLPVIMDNVVYLPLDFIKSTFNLSVNYDNNNGTVYFLPYKQPNSAQTPAFINISNKYSISGSSEFFIDLSPVKTDFSDSLINIKDTNGEYSAAITCDIFDSSAADTITEYTGDQSVPDDILFNKFVELRKNSYDTLSNHYTNSYLLGDKDGSEALLKIFSQSDGILYGTKTYQYLYDTGRFNSAEWEEKVHIDFIVPVYSNRKIYNIDFTINKGLVNDSTLSRMAGLLQAIHIEGLSDQREIPDFLKISDTIKSANKGIYNTTDTGSDFTDVMLTNEYRISIPSGYIPWNNNNISYDVGYISYKIDQSSDFSVTYEPSETVDNIAKKIDSVAKTLGNNVNISDLGNIRLGGRDFLYALYKTGSQEDSQFYYDFYTYAGSKLYTIRYHSKTKPDISEVNTLHRILESFSSSPELVTEAISAPDNEISYQNYGGKENGFIISVPKKWSVNKKADSDKQGLLYTIKSPNYSGSFDVSIYNTEATSDNSPYKDKQYRVLTNSIYENNGITVKRMLTNYLGSDGKRKLCFSKEISFKDTSYTLYISVNEYMTKDGKITDSSISSIMDTISRSFNISN